MFILLYLLYLANIISLKSQLLRRTRISIIRFLTASKRSYQNAGFGIEYYLFKLVSHFVMVTSYSLVFFLLQQLLDDKEVVKRFVIHV